MGKDDSWIKKTSRADPFTTSINAKEIYFPASNWLEEFGKADY